MTKKTKKPAAIQQVDAYACPSCGSHDLRPHDAGHVADRERLVCGACGECLWIERGARRRGYFLVKK